MQMVLRTVWAVGVKRKSGENPGQYLLLWIPFRKEFDFTELFATGAMRWEGSVKGISQKTCHFAL